MSAICDLTNQVNAAFAQINQNFAVLFAGAANDGVIPKVTVAERTGIFGYGQSLSVGSDGIPVEHTTAVNGHKTFSTGPNMPSGAELLSEADLFALS